MILLVMLTPPAEGQAQQRANARGRAGVVTAAAPALLEGHERGVIGMAFSPDGATLASTDGRVLRFWDAATAQARGSIPLNESRGNLAFSPDGSLLAVHASSKTRILQVASGREMGAIPLGGSVQGLSFLDDNKTLVSSEGSVLALYEVGLDKPIRKFPPGPNPARFAVSPDGKLAVVSTTSIPGDGVKPDTAAILDLVLGKFRGNLPGIDFSVDSVAFTSDGRRIVIAGGHEPDRPGLKSTFYCEAALKVWDAATGQLLRAIPYAMTRDGEPPKPSSWPIKSWITHMAVSPDGSTVAVDNGNTVDFWNLQSMELVDTIRPDINAGCTGLVFSPDGQTLARAEYDLGHRNPAKPIRLIVAPTGRGRRPESRPRVAPAEADGPGEVAVFRGHGTGVSGVAFARDGKLVLSGGDDKMVRLWEPTTGREVLKLVGHEESVTGVTISRDGRTALTGSNDKTARFWDLVTGREIRKLVGHDKAVVHVALTADAKRALTADYDGTARLWDLTTGAEVRRFIGHTDGVIGLTLASNERTFVTGSWDKTARLWDLATGREIRTFSGHTDKVGDVVFAPDGRKVLTAGTDGTLRLWDVSTGKELTRVDVGADAGWAVAISPDGRRALTSSDNDATLWDLQTRTPPVRMALNNGQVRGVAIAPDGRLAVIATAGGAAHVWRLPRATPVPSRR